MAALNDTILRNILGDGTGPKKDWVSKNKDDPVDDAEYNKYLSAKAAEQGLEKTQKLDVAEGKKFVKGLKTFTPKGKALSKPIMSTDEYKPEAENIVSGLEAYTEPKVEKAEKVTIAKYVGKPLSMDVLRLVDPTKTKYPNAWKETEQAQPLSYKAKQLGKNFLTNLAEALPTDDERIASKERELDARSERWAKNIALTNRELLVSGQENELALKNLALQQSKSNIRKQQLANSRTGKFLEFVQRPGLQDFGANVSSNLSTGMGSSIIGSFQDPGSSGELKRAQLQLTAYTNYLKKNKGPLSENQELKLDALKKRVLYAQQKVASSGFAGRGGGQLSLMGSSRPMNIQRFTGIGPTGNYGSYGPEAMARLGVGQSLEASHPINKVKAFGWGERGSSLPGLLGAPTQPIMPTDRITAFTKMDIRSDKITGLLGKNPTPIPTTDIKSKMRRIINKKY